MNNKKIFYTHKAVNDLGRLRDFIAKDNPKAAMETAEKLQLAVNQLLDFPLLGKEIKTSKKIASFCDLMTGKYVIRYVVLSHEIHILRIWHGKENR